MEEQSEELGKGKKKAWIHSLSIFHYTKCSQERLMSVHGQALLHPRRRTIRSSLWEMKATWDQIITPALIKSSSELSPIKEKQQQQQPKQCVLRQNLKTCVPVHQNHTINSNGKDRSSDISTTGFLLSSCTWNLTLAKFPCSGLRPMSKEDSHLETDAWSPGALSSPRSGLSTPYVKAWQCWDAAAGLPSGG